MHTTLSQTESVRPTLHTFIGTTFLSGSRRAATTYRLPSEADYIKFFHDIGRSWRSALTLCKNTIYMI